MSTSPPNRSYTGPLPYKLVVNARQQGLAYARQRLQTRFPTLTDEQWKSFFTEYQPMLWMEDESQGVIVEEEDLKQFASWIHLSLYPEQKDHLPLYGHIVSNSTWYISDARTLLAADPELITPESIEEMRLLVKRLSVGNGITRRVSHTFESSGEQQ